MPFDLSTARPAGSGGFDLSTAKPDTGSKPMRSREELQAEVDAYNERESGIGGALRRYALGSGAEELRTVGRVGKNIAQGVLALPAMIGDAPAALYNLGSYALGSESRAPLAFTRAVQSIGGEQLAPKSGYQRITDMAMQGAAGGLTNAASGVALSASLGPVLSRVGGMMAQQPVAQTVGGMTGAASSGVAGELGADPVTQFAAGLLGGWAGGKAGQKLEQGSYAPTKEQLRAESSAAYQRADDAGVVVNDTGVQSLKKSIRDAVLDDYDEGLHPHVKAVLTRLEKTDGQLTLQDIEKLRRFASKQEGAAYKIQGGQDSARIVGKIVDVIDDFTDGDMGQFTAAGNAKAGAKALTEARLLYRRNRKATVIEDLIERARDNAGEFSVSGLENGVRKEFRLLAKNPKRLAQFSVQEQAAIKSISRGTNTVNALRYLGKLAPTGQMSQLGWLAGVMATGGKAAAIPALGVGARFTAGRMQLGAANNLGEMIRRGGPVAPPPPLNPWLQVAPSAAVNLLAPQRKVEQ